MHGGSRAAYAEGEKALGAALSDADPAALGDDLFGVVGVLDGSASLRRAFADSARDEADRQALARQIFGTRVGAPAMAVVDSVVAQRWAEDRDLADSVESFAVQAVLAGAERAGRADQVEDELFRFERTVAANPQLRDTLSTRNADADGKAGLVQRLLDGKATPETVRLARQAVAQPRGRRLDRTFEEYLRLAAIRRDELTAVVTSAVPLDAQQEERLRSALEGLYATTVTIQAVVDPRVVGGVHVRVGDEVIDGTILRRINEARRHITGT